MKKITKIALLLLLIFIKPEIAKASVTASISVSTSNTIIGNSGSATLNINAGGQHIGQIYGTFSCGALGDKDLKFVVADNPPTSKSYTINWTARNTGTYNCTVSNLQIGLLENPSEFTTASVAQKTITVAGNTTNNKSNNNNNNDKKANSGTTAEKKEYDSDNNLKNLEIENYKISPAFNKDTTEYKLEVDESVEKINVKATKSSEKAEIDGIGEKNLTPGENTIEIRVTAENGNEKKYKIIVTVKDQHPITVKIDGKKYTLVKKNNNILEKKEHYEEEIIKIDNQEVVSYINKNTKTRLVILKDENNQPAYYVYHEQTKKYEKYRTITIGNITLQLLDSSETPKHYHKYSLNVKDEKIEIYKTKKTHKVGLIYGTNIKTGNTGYYVYDENEETLSKYYNEEVKELKKEILNIKNRAMLFMGIASAITIITITISIIKAIKRKKRRAI